MLAQSSLVGGKTPVTLLQLVEPSILSISVEDYGSIRLTCCTADIGGRGRWWRCRGWAVNPEENTQHGIQESTSNRLSCAEMAGIDKVFTADGNGFPLLELSTSAAASNINCERTGVSNFPH